MDPVEQLDSGRQRQLITDDDLVDGCASTTKRFGRI